VPHPDLSLAALSLILNRRYKTRCIIFMRMTLVMAMAVGNPLYFPSPCCFMDTFCHSQVSYPPMLAHVRNDNLCGRTVGCKLLVVRKLQPLPPQTHICNDSFIPQYIHCFYVFVFYKKLWRIHRISSDPLCFTFFHSEVCLKTCAHRNFFYYCANNEA
jgi:hypothetical protein